MINQERYEKAVRALTSETRFPRDEMLAALRDLQGQDFETCNHEEIRKDAHTYLAVQAPGSEETRPVKDVRNLLFVIADLMMCRAGHKVQRGDIDGEGGEDQQFCALSGFNIPLAVLKRLVFVAEMSAPNPSESKPLVEFRLPGDFKLPPDFFKKIASDLAEELTGNEGNAPLAAPNTVDHDAVTQRALDFHARHKNVPDSKPVVELVTDLLTMVADLSGNLGFQHIVVATLKGETGIEGRIRALRTLNIPTHLLQRLLAERGVES